MKTRVGNIATDQLRGIVERIERLEQEKAAIAADIRDVFAESKANGFDQDGIRAVLKLRKMDANERDEREHVVDLYKRCLGMAPDLEDETEGAAA